MQDDTSGLSQLGSQGTNYLFDGPKQEMLETFPNPFPERDYIVSHQTSEFSSLCPRTGQPDFCNLLIEMTPDQRIVESKSLKLYLFSYRNYGAFMERIVNTILSDLVAASDPRWCRVSGIFNARGGITTTVIAEHRK